MIHLCAVVLSGYRSCDVSTAFTVHCGGNHAANGNKRKVFTRSLPAGDGADAGHPVRVGRGEGEDCGSRRANSAGARERGGSRRVRGCRAGRKKTRPSSPPMHLTGELPRFPAVLGFSVFGVCVLFCML